ncbi:IPT/TIG domain-containing protein [Lamprocystis purpurea]|jgi:hypothetical protein|uniref:IPT/TIG domain-containing protein n=1 Tax=Lamprocystis purpurea TaxID=61598 RepID=UPI000363ECC6|nr:IPT/TIG domain-containing protein [Lamprocystis purpurea]
MLPHQLIADDFNLSVTNGSGSGAYQALSTLHVWADPYGDEPVNESGEPYEIGSPTRVFDQWTGDTQYLADPLSAHTTLVMPDRDVSISAGYRDMPRWGAPRVYSFFPDQGGNGVIFLIHGGKGNSHSIVGDTEILRFIDDANNRGFAVVAVSSFDRANVLWDIEPDAEDNIDLQRIAAVRLDLIRRGVMTSADPVYLLGISHGGIFVSLFNDANQAYLEFPVAARAVYISPGQLESLATSNTPTMFVLAENDTTVGGESAQQAYNDFLFRGVPTQLWLHHASPLYPERFWRLEGISRDDSRVIYQALKDAGILDADDYLLVDPDMSPLYDKIPEAYRNFETMINDQLKVTYSAHWFMSDFNRQVLDFFEAPSTIVEYDPRIVSFTPDSGTPGTVVEITGIDLFEVSGVTFNGIPAVFEWVSAERIVAAVPPAVSPGPISVQTGRGTATSTSDFQVPLPVIAGVSPNSGTVGAVVTIEGQALFNIESVRFNGVPAGSFSGDLQRLFVQVPQGASTGPIEVTNHLGTTTSPEDFVVAGPSVTGFSPAAGKVGDVVTVTGVAFYDVSEVAFAGVSAEILGSSPSTIVVRVPVQATTGPITVTTANGVGASTSEFKVYPRPEILSFTPTSGSVGTSVTINGSGFEGATRVLFGATSTSFEIRSDKQIVAPVPVGTKTSRIWVIAPGGTATSARYFVPL